MARSPEVTVEEGHSRRLRLARLLMLLPCAISLTVLGLWVADRWELGTLGTDDIPMAPSTALLVLALATTRVRSLSSGARLPSVVCGAVAAAGGLLSLASAVGPIEALLARLLAIAPLSVGTVPIGVMSSLTATAMVLLGGALCSWGARSALVRTAGSVAAILATLLALTVATGYALRAPLLYGAAVPMAATTSVALALLGLGFLLANDAHAWPLAQLSVGPWGAAGTLPSPGGATALAIVISAAVIVGTGVYLDSSRNALRLAATEDLTAAMDLKRGDVARWYHERAADAQTLVESRLDRDEIVAYLASGGSGEPAETLQNWGTSLRRAYGYSSVVMFDSQGQARFVSGTPPAPVRPEALTRATRDRGVVVDDFSADDDSGRRQLAFLAPISLGATGATGEAAVDVVVALVVDARRDLYPMLERWPFRSQTAETLLIRQDGSDVVYLTDLRGQPSGPRPLHRLPMPETGQVVARALRGADGPIEGTDYTGTRVLAAAGPVAGTPWLLMVQQHRSEVYEPFWREVRLAFAFSTLVLLTTVFALATSTRQQTLRTLQAQLAVERERQDSDERLRSAMSASLDPFLVLDNDGGIVEWNERAEAVFGWTRAEALGHPFTTFVLAAPFDAAYADALQMARSGEPNVRLGTRTTGSAKRRDGSVFPAELTVIPVHLHDRLAFSAVVRDITEQVAAALEVASAQAESRRLLREADDARRALLNIIDDQRHTEAALRESENQLESRVLQRTMQLEAANRELEAFSYSVSHDLRAPLRAIDGYARILDEDCGPALDGEGRRRLAVIQREARRMGLLIDDLLRFSRLGRQPLETSVIDMTELAQEVAGELTRDLPDGRRVDLRIEPLPQALGDLGVIRQVWVNLLGNAVKFTGTRTVATIVVSGRLENGLAEFSVADNGVGFDMKYADKLFGVFQRLHAASEFEGTGVGLALSQRIVARHGGRMWAEAADGQGATFFFALPPATGAAVPDGTGAVEIAAGRSREASTGRGSTV